MYFFGNNGKSFYTEGCGSKIEMFEHNKNFQNFKLNRMNSSCILTLLPTECNKFDEECEEDENELFFSENEGNSWVSVLKHVYDANW